MNAANSSLMGGGGVDGAIHRKGGTIILEECKRLRAETWKGGLPPGMSVLTTAGKLQAKYVIHTVGPIWRGGKESESLLLTEAYKNTLELAVYEKISSIAFPSISTGAYGYPIFEASRIALNTVKEFVQKVEGLQEIIFVLFSDQDLKTYIQAAEEILSL